MPDEEPLRFCATKDSVAAVGFCRWPDGAIPWALTAEIPGVPEEAFRGAVAWALGECARSCGIIPVETQTAAKARILCGTRHIDGPGGVLAESELPCGNVSRCRQWYDSSDRWDWEWPTFSRQKISLRLVVLHELLHALGLPHAPQNADAIIAPFYNPNLTGLRPYDVAELQRRYGPPAVTPAPPIPTPVPTPTPGGGMLDVILKLMKFLQDNPWIIDLLKRLLDRAALQGGVLKLEEVEQEIQQMRQQLKAP